MKITIDISSIVYETGVSSYTRNLVENLIKIDKSNEYTLFGGSLRRLKDLNLKVSEFKGKFKKILYPIPPFGADLFFNRFHIIPIETFIGQTDVFHSSDWTQPKSRAFNITTIHDLVPIKYPKLSHPKIVRVHKKRLKLVRKEVDRVIVPSEATYEDAVKFGLEEQKVRVIPEAPDPIYKRVKKSEIEKLKAKYRISGDYLLAVGVNQRKNISRTIEACEKVRADTGLRLVVIGEPQVKLKSVRGVMMLGHIAKEEMPVFYSGAKALVYPSLYEGFGLPILEAYACDTCVVTSNLGSMKEVSGGASFLVDPYNTGSIADGIRTVLDDRDKYIKAGRKRLEQFSWENIAEQTMSVYQECGV